MRGWAIVAVVLLVGCGASPAPAPASSARVEPTAIARWECLLPQESERRGAPSVTVATRRPAPRQTVRIRPPAPRLRERGPRMDVHLERARLASALRLLAEAADLSIVIGEGLDREVTVDLRRVRPVEAMRALAVAHDVELSMVGRTLVARAR